MNARDRLAAEVGPDAVIDAAAVVGTFCTMVRIADATGIPLDPPTQAYTEDLRDAIGLHEFASARNTRPSGFLMRMLAPALRPIAPAFFKVASKVVAARAKKFGAA